MVNWTPQKDQTILKGIFAFHDIKNSQPLLQYLAKEIGEGCTPKAVSHRLANLRNSGKMVNSDGAASTPKKIAATSRLARTPTASLGRAKASKGRKTTGGDTTSEDDDGEPIVSPSADRKRTRTSATRKTYAESDATTGDEEEDEFTPKSKKVKTEPVEEEGTTGAAGTNDPIEEEDEAVSFV
ncbi:hypothetical protein N0V86_005370 [Didymella sp. IMI 355093]|nr:hypothetical protein N0V86_005370 [Didymella sp. IMI 355093]